MAAHRKLATAEQVVAGGFTVIPIKFSEKSEACHYLYVKAHSVRDTNVKKPKDRTLFILNVPPYCNEACLQRVFSQCGKIEDVFLHKNPTSGLPEKNKSEFFPTVEKISGFKVAYVVFKSAASVTRAKNLPYDEPLILSTAESPIRTGIAKWCREYSESYVSKDDLQEEVTKYLEAHDRKIEEDSKRAKEEAEPDSEGWVTVTHHGRNKGTPRTEVAEKKITAKEKKKRKRKELINFYTFQIRESKRDKIAELRQRFEEDKQKIALMKASRKFRPY